MSVSIDVKQIPAKDWAKLSEQAHTVVFGKHKPAEWDRIDFALVTEDNSGLRTYVTCREVSHDSLYWQYGGSFPGVRNSPSVVKDMTAMLIFVAKSYKRLNFFVENTNWPMLKLAHQFKIPVIGTRTFQNTVLLEHLLEFNGG